MCDEQKPAARAAWPRSPTILAILGAFCFAGQHPLTKRVADTIPSPLLVAVMSGVVGLSLVPCLLLAGRRGGQFSRILRKDQGVRRWAFQSVVGALSTILYVVGLSKTHAVHASLLLNTSPIWGAIWTSTIAGKPRPPKFWSTVVLAFLAVSLPVVATEDTSGQAFSPFSLCLLVVPGLYTLRTSLVARWFPASAAGAAAADEIDSFELAAVASVTSFVAMLPVAAWCIVTTGIASMARVDALGWAEFVLGTVCVSIGTIAFVQAKRLSDGQWDYVTMFNLMIPAFSAMLGTAMFLVSATPGLLPSPWHVVGIGILLSAMIRFVRASPSHGK